MKQSVTAFRVFVLDDEGTIARTTPQILLLAGFEAIPFTDPNLLLEACRECPPDLVMSDIIMPEMDGFHLAETLKATLPGRQVMLFTGQAGVEELGDLALEQGLDLEVLSKPLRPTDLVSRIRRIATKRAR